MLIVDILARFATVASEVEGAVLGVDGDDGTMWKAPEVMAFFKVPSRL